MIDEELELNVMPSSVTDQSVALGRPFSVKVTLYSGGVSG